MSKEFTVNFKFALKKVFVSFCLMLSGIMFGLQTLFHFEDIELWVKIIFGISSIITIGVGIHIWMNRWEGLRRHKDQKNASK